MTPRPALPAVLATLTGETIARPVTIAWARGVHHIPATDREKVCVLAPWSRTPATRTPVGRNDDGSVRYVEREAHTITPAEALEMLRDAALWPWPIGDVSAPRWWCEACDGSGTYPDNSRNEPCELCVGEAWNDRHDEWGTLAASRTMPEVVAVVSLGAERLRQVEALVGALADVAPKIGRRLVWRVAPETEIDDAVRSNLGGDVALPDGSYEPGSIAHTWAVENALTNLRSAGSQKFRAAWPEACPWTQPALIDAWPMLRALAVECGVHLIEATPARCVIGVEGVT